MAVLAQTDVGIELWHSATGLANSYAKLIDITSLPAMGAAQGKIEVTVLSSTKKQYLADREDLPDLSFEYNYEATNFAAVLAVCNVRTYLMAIYGDGSGAVIYGEGNTYQNQVGLGSPVKATFNFVPESIDFKTAVEVAALTQGS